MIRNPFFKSPKLRRFDYQPVFYDPKKDTGEDTVEEKRFDFKAAHEELKGEISPGFGMYRGGSVEYDAERVRKSRVTKMVLLIVMAFICLAYYFLPRPAAITLIEEAFEMPPLLYEAGAFLIVFIMMIFFIREQNKV